MQTEAYEGYFDNGHFYASGKVVRIPEKRRVIITVLEETGNSRADNEKTDTPDIKLQFDFLTQVPPLPDSFFDPLPEEELKLWEQ